MHPYYCLICEKYNQDVNELLLAGNNATTIVQLFDNSFTRQTLAKHIKDCLQKTSYQLKKESKITTVLDVDARYNDLTQKSYEMLESAREVLLVNGELNLHPRSWEISCVYEHPTLKDELTGKPLVMSDTLDNVIALLKREGIKIKKTMLKAEDPRKTYRSAILAHKELLENYFRLFGAYKQEQNTFEEELAVIRKTIQLASEKTGSSYRSTLEYYIEVYQDRIRRDLVEELRRELNTLPKILTDGAKSFLKDLEAQTPPGMPQKECLSEEDESASDQLG